MASNFTKMYGLFIEEGRAVIEGRECGGGAGVNRISGQGRYPELLVLISSTNIRKCGDNGGIWCLLW